MQRSESRLTRLAALALTLLAGAAPALAEDESEDTSRSGPYLGVSVSGALPAFDAGDLYTNTALTQTPNDEDPSFGISARAGWRLLPYLATELQYEWVNEWKMRTGGRTCATASAQLLTGNLRLIVPFETVQPYLLAGVGGGRYEVETTNVSLGLGQACVRNPGTSATETDWELTARFGGGFDLYLSRRVVFNLETTTLYSDDELLGADWPFVSISGGFQYRF